MASHPGGHYCDFYTRDLPLTRQLVWRSSTRTFHPRMPEPHMRSSDLTTSLIARFMGPTWGPSGADRTQVGPMLAPWTLLSGMTLWQIVVPTMATRWQGPCRWMEPLFNKVKILLRRCESAYMCYLCWKQFCWHICRNDDFMVVLSGRMAMR